MEKVATRAVILARGLGTRMRREDRAAGLDPRQATAADNGLKAMIPVGRPFLDYLLGALADAGYRQVCLVIGPEHRQVHSYCLEQLKCQRLELHTAIQEHPLGTADAVASARAFTGEEPFLVINSDNYYPVSSLRALRCLESSGTALFHREGLVQGNIPPERVARFAIAEVRDGYLHRIIEKPDDSMIAALDGRAGVSMNCWRFDSAIFEACARIRPSSRGELELPDAVEYSMQHLGCRYRVLMFREPVLDLSSRGDIAQVAARLAEVKVRL